MSVSVDGQNSIHKLPNFQHPLSAQHGHSTVGSLSPRALSQAAPQPHSQLRTQTFSHSRNNSSSSRGTSPQYPQTQNTQIGIQYCPDTMAQRDDFGNRAMLPTTSAAALLGKLASSTSSNPLHTNANNRTNTTITTPSSVTGRRPSLVAERKQLSLSPSKLRRSNSYTSPTLLEAQRRYGFGDRSASGRAQNRQSLRYSFSDSQSVLDSSGISHDGPPAVSSARSSRSSSPATARRPSTTLVASPPIAIGGPESHASIASLSSSPPRQQQTSYVTKTSPSLRQQQTSPNPPNPQILLSAHLRLAIRTAEAAKAAGLGTNQDNKDLLKALVAAMSDN